MKPIRLKKFVTKDGSVDGLDYRSNVTFDDRGEKGFLLPNGYVLIRTGTSDVLVPPAQVESLTVWEGEVEALFARGPGRPKKETGGE